MKKKRIEINFCLGGIETKYQVCCLSLSFCAGDFLARNWSVIQVSVHFKYMLAIKINTIKEKMIVNFV